MSSLRPSSMGAAYAATPVRRLTIAAAMSGRVSGPSSTRSTSASGSSARVASGAWGEAQGSSR